MALNHPHREKLKAIFIDFDGTLVNSLEDLYGIYCDFLKYYELKGNQEEFAELNGPTINEILTILIEKYHLPEPSEKLLAVYWSMLEQYYAEVALPFPGAEKFLKKTKRLGVVLGIVTSAGHSLVDPFLKRHGLESYFNTIITAEGILQSKPHPEIYQKALKSLGLEGSQALAIEDSMKGVLSATEAGIYTWRINTKLKSIRHHPGWLEISGWPAIEELFIELYE